MVLVVACARYELLKYRIRKLSFFRLRFHFQSIGIDVNNVSNAAVITEKTTCRRERWYVYKLVCACMNTTYLSAGHLYLPIYRFYAYNTVKKQIHVK